MLARSKTRTRPYKGLGRRKHTDDGDRGVSWRAAYLPPRPVTEEERTPSRASSLRARQPMRRWRGAPRRRPPEFDDEEFLEFLRHQRCRVTWWHEHARRIDPHHARHDEHGRSLGANMKNDKRALSLCRWCHRCIDRQQGPFKEWGRDRVRAWVDEQIAQQRADFLARRPDPTAADTAPGGSESSL
jgi:hypothetical protein